MNRIIIDKLFSTLQLVYLKYFQYLKYYFMMNKKVLPQTILYHCVILFLLGPGFKNGKSNTVM